MKNLKSKFDTKIKIDMHIFFTILVNVFPLQNYCIFLSNIFFQVIKNHLYEPFIDDIEIKT